MTKLELVAVDIETTGFELHDEVTTIGFALPLGCHVFCQTGGRSVSGVETAVTERAPCDVMVSVRQSEQELFEAVSGFVTARLQGQDRLLAAYNGEVWQGGFDLPFLRSRFARLDCEWPFHDVPYTDLLPVMEKQFNTTIGDDARGDLAGVYDVLIGGEFSAVDPFEESAEAVTAFENGNLADVVVHNIADVQRTAALGDVAERYCSKSDFQVKSLTPAINEQYQ